MSRVAELHIGADPAAWAEAGFAVQDGLAVVGGVGLRLLGGGGGILRWAVVGAPSEDVDEVDGLPTSHVAAPPVPGPPHPLGVVAIDHLVVMTPDLDRTVAAIERDLGVPLRRIREADAGGRPIRQAFFRLGELVFEVVGGAAPSGDGPATFWGITFTVAALDVAVARLGPDRVGAAKPAVQPGRHIATLRASAGLGVPVALMDPDPARRR